MGAPTKGQDKTGLVERVQKAAEPILRDHWLTVFLAVVGLLGTAGWWVYASVSHINATQGKHDDAATQATLFMEAFDCHDTLRTHNEARRYEESTRVFDQFCKKANVRAIRQALRKQLYAEALRAHSIGGTYNGMNEKQLEDIESDFRLEFPCSLVNLHLACLWAGQGKPEKARPLCKQATDKYLEACTRSTRDYSCRPPDNASADLNDYCALLVLMELTKPDWKAERDAIESCWVILDTYGKHEVIQPTAVYYRLEASALQRLARHLSEGNAPFAARLRTIKEQLLKFQYAVEVNLGTRNVRRIPFPEGRD